MKTGPAWDALLATLRANEHGAQLLADAYAAGRRDERDEREAEAPALVEGIRRSRLGRE